MTTPRTTPRSPRRSRTVITQLRDQVGSTVVVCGFIETLRLQKAIQFMIARDHTGCVQVVHRRSDDPKLAERLDELTPESAVVVTGIVVADPRVKLGGIEVRLADLEVVARAESPLPIDERSAPDLQLDHPWLALRDRRRRLVFEARTVLLRGMREYWRAEGMLELHSPKLMGAPSESGAEVFALDYFGRPAYLAQSPQFYKQLAMAAGLDGVFEVGPVFRAEPSHTTRHATEFTSIDVEIAWVGSHHDVMDHQETLLTHAIRTVVDRLGAQLRDELGVEVPVPARPFPRMTLEAAREELRRHTAWHPPDADDGTLDPAGERALSQLVAARHGHPFVFVTDYPASSRPFYHLRPDEAPALTRSFDLLYHGVEITTGAQREHRHDRLASQALEAGLDLHLLRSYLDTFRYGCPPHGGFGLGLERLMMALLGLASIREATFLPRTPSRIAP